MNRLAAPPGKLLGTQLTSIVKNPAASGETRHYAIRFSNMTNVNAFIAQCVWLDASDNGNANPVLAINTPVRTGADGTVITTFILEPGDDFQAAASASGAIHAVAQQIDAEPRQ